MKGKDESEGYAEFQGIASRDKKDYLNGTMQRNRTIERERLEISSRKLKISREHLM